MDATKLIILLCCTYEGIVASNSHNIPVNEYKTELHDLGQHVEYPETPVKIIKITKTIAVKVPVPYPVKVIEKVPYPVHVSKPYPVPVPQLVHVPHPGPAPAPHAPAPAAHEPLHYHAAPAPAQDYHQDEEHPSEDSSYYGHPEGASYEVKSYDDAFKDYLKAHGGGNQDHPNRHYR